MSSHLQSPPLHTSSGPYIPPQHVLDLILQAGQTRIRVDKNQLAAHSPVFRDMFSRAEAAGVDLTQGLPVVRIDDDPEDMGMVLAALYDVPAFYMETQKPLKLVSAMLRLGKKYGLDELYEDAISRLEHDFPSTLREYQELYKEAPSGVWGPARGHLKPYPALPFDVVNLARAHGLSQILPAAFYSCITVDFRITDIERAILGGLLRGDGTVGHLSAGDKEICLRALGVMIDVQRVDAFPYFFGGAEDSLPRICTSRKKCKAAAASFRQWEAYPCRCNIALWGLHWWPSTLCDGCAHLAETMHQRGQGHIWQQLPSYFGLPPWENLLNRNP